MRFVSFTNLDYDFLETPSISIWRIISSNSEQTSSCVPGPIFTSSSIGYIGIIKRLPKMISDFFLNGDRRQNIATSLQSDRLRTRRPIVKLDGWYASEK